MKKRMIILETLGEIPDAEETSLQYHEAIDIMRNNLYNMGTETPEDESWEEFAEWDDEEDDWGSDEDDDTFLSESYNWDKFNKDLIKREGDNLRNMKEKRIDENSPQREYNKRYREDWKNSTRWKR